MRFQESLKSRSGVLNLLSVGLSGVPTEPGLRSSVNAISAVLNHCSIFSAPSRYLLSSILEIILIASIPNLLTLSCLICLLDTMSQTLPCLLGFLRQSQNSEFLAPLSSRLIVVLSNIWRRLFPALNLYSDATLSMTQASQILLNVKESTLVDLFHLVFCLSPFTPPTAFPHITAHSRISFYVFYWSQFRSIRPSLLLFITYTE